MWSPRAVHNRLAYQGDGQLTLDRTVKLEALFKNAFPIIHKVTIHTEPESERGLMSARRRRHEAQSNR